jgi:hypothetical protein
MGSEKCESVAKRSKRQAIAKKLTEAGSSVRRTDKVLRAQIETILKLRY